MKSATTFHTSAGRLSLAALLLLIGYGCLMLFPWAWWALLVSGALAWLVAFNSSGRVAFGRPRRLWLVPLGVLLYFGVSILVGIGARTVGLKWTGNPAAAAAWWPLIAQLPLMLMGEELLGIGVLEGARAQGCPWWVSTLLSGLVFGLIHFFDYWDDSLGSTLLHVLLLQGVARLILNRIYIAGGQSIWRSWLTHLLIDLVALAI